MLTTLIFIATAMRAPAECRPAPALSAMLNQINRVGNPLDRLTRENVQQVRAQREAGTTLNEIPVAQVDDVNADGVPVRVYKPGANLPTLVFYHGGGWTIGSRNTYDSVARYLAAQIPAVVVSVEYRLAPEHPFPAATDDAITALRWARAHIQELGGDEGRLAVAGDSAGGNLAAVAARAAGVPLRAQALFYPSVDIGHDDTDSFRLYGEGYLLTRKAVDTFRSFYLPNPADRERPEAAPLRAPLAGTPPTYLLLSGCDPLRDEGRHYGEALTAAGVKVEVLEREDIVHGTLNFFNQASSPAVSSVAEDLLEEIVRRVRSFL